MKEKNILRKIADVIVSELGLSKEEAKLMEVKLEQMKLSDGETVLEADSFEKGMEVMIVTSDEQKIPLAPSMAGEHYELEDGRLLTVVREGIIESIEMPSEVEEEVAVEEKVVASTETTAPQPTAKKVVETSTREMHFSAVDFENLQKENEELKNKLSALELKLEEVTVAPIAFNPEKQNVVQVDLSKTDSKTRITNELNNLIK